MKLQCFFLRFMALLDSVINYLVPSWEVSVVSFDQHVEGLKAGLEVSLLEVKSFKITDWHCALLCMYPSVRQLCHFPLKKQHSKPWNGCIFAYTGCNISLEIKFNFCISAMDFQYFHLLFATFYIFWNSQKSHLKQSVYLLFHRPVWILWNTGVESHMYYPCIDTLL